MGLLRALGITGLVAAAGCASTGDRYSGHRQQPFLAYAAEGKDSKTVFGNDRNVRVLRDFDNLEASIVQAEPGHLLDLQKRGDIAFFARYAGGIGRREEFDTYQTVEADGTQLPTGYTPDWANARIGREALDAHGIDGRTRTVWVMDTGIFADHEAFAGNEIRFHDFIKYRKEPYDDRMHGTWTAGIVARILPRAKLTAGKVLDGHGSTTLTDLLEGFDQAIADNPDVLSMSYGFALNEVGEGLSLADADAAVDEALRRCHQRGILLVASAGNEQAWPVDGRPVIYPARSPHVIAAGATDPMNEIAWFSNLGGDIYTPGVWILGPDHEKPQEYIAASGTSASAPIAAAAIAALCERHGHRCTRDEVLQLFRERSHWETSVIVDDGKKMAVQFPFLSLPKLLE